MPPKGSRFKFFTKKARQAVPHSQEFADNTLRADASGFGGLPTDSGEKRSYTLKEVLGGIFDFELVEFDPRYVNFSCPRHHVTYCRY